MRLLAVIGVIAYAGCIGDPTLPCGELRCPAGAACIAGACYPEALVTACEGLSDGDPCMTFDSTHGRCGAGVCRVPVCGNAVVEDAEVCDDGNVNAGDGCSARCDSDETCGNGTIDYVRGEQCDDGNTADGDSCRPSCVAPRCGDGIVDPQNGEACDAGEANSSAQGAACRLDCQPGRCGDGVHDPTEACDDGNLVSGDGCSGDCRSTEICGNGYVDAVTGEQCDAGPGLSRDGCTSRCTIEIETWRTPPWSISDRNGHSLAYDPNRRRAVMFGGRTSGGFAPIAETWEWDGSSWRQMQPGASPSPRYHTAMAFDALRGTVVLFGGDTGTGLAGETWEWDGVTWRPIATAQAPSPRAGHRMAWDAVGQRIVLFGGATATGVSDETWLFAAGSWTLAAVTSSPPARAHPGFAEDPLRDRIVLFGGTTGPRPYLSDTWEWDGLTSSWIGPLASGPGARFAPVASWVNPGVLIAGGTEHKGGPSIGPAGDTWHWDGSAWSRVQDTGSIASGAAVYDEARGRVIAFSGTGSSGGSFTWSGSAWQSIPDRAIPPARTLAAITTDLGRARIVMFGGAQSVAAYDDTWEYDGVWTPRTEPGPPGRYHGAMAYHGKRLVSVLFGGAQFCLCASGTRQDTWLWDGVAWQMEPLAGAPGRRAGHFMAYDAAREQIVMYGGTGYDGQQREWNDTWVWDGTWSNTNASSPPQATAVAMAYDAARERVVLLTETTTWEWDGTAWADRMPSVLPAGTRIDPALVYNADRGRVVLLGGNGDALDSWEWDGATWRPLAPSATPPPRFQPAAAYDPTTRSVVVFGGGLNGELGDTWALAFESSSLPADRCVHGLDTDGDGLAGCSDPDCWARCSPSCPPLTSCDPALPHCGNGTCESPREDYAICPADCP